MSGISGISGSNSYLWLEQILAKTSASFTTGSSETTTSSTSTDATTSITSSDGLTDQLKSAISSALSEAEDSGDTSDLMSVIQEAIQETLNANGIDTSQNAPGGMAPPPPPSDGDNPMRSQLQSQLEAMGLEGDELDSVMSQVDTAVSEAMDSAQSDGTDFAAAVEDAIYSTLESNGIDTSQISLEPPTGMQGGMMPPPPPPGDASATTSSTDTSSTTGTDSIDSSSTTDIASMLEELLSALGYSSDEQDSLLGFLVDTSS